MIGSDAKGTMNRAVTALKRTYETPVFPQLDAARSLLGARTEAKLAHMKVGAKALAYFLSLSWKEATSIENYQYISTRVKRPFHVACSPRVRATVGPAP